MANLARRAEWEAEHDRKLGGRKPFAPAADALAKRTLNTTDPDSRGMRRPGRRTVQGYNAQVVASPEQIILAAEITQAANDSAQLEPMIHHALGVLAAAGINQALEVVLADGGYWNSSQIARLREQEIQPIVPTKSRTRTAPRRLSARQGLEARRVEHILGTPDGQALYRRRGADRRTHLRPHQDSAGYRPLPTSRPGGLRGRMKADRRSSQPAQALAPGTRRAHRLIRPGTATCADHASRSWRPPHAANPAGGGVCATASSAGLFTKRATRLELATFGLGSRLSGYETPRRADCISPEPSLSQAFRLR